MLTISRTNSINKLYLFQINDVVVFRHLSNFPRKSVLETHMSGLFYSFRFMCIAVPHNPPIVVGRS